MSSRKRNVLYVIFFVDLLRIPISYRFDYAYSSYGKHNKNTFNKSFIQMGLQGYFEGIWRKVY